MISHNMEDVRAVADRIVVLRLGRNNGVFDPDASNQELVSAITGATDNAVSRRAGAASRGRRPTRRRTMTSTQDRHTGPAACSTAATSGVTHDEGVGGAVRAFVDRVRSGDLGSLPVVVGLVGHLDGLPDLNPIFLSSNNLVNLLFDCSTVGVISLGIVCVLMVGEIDLSVGSVSGFASAIVGVLWVNQGWPVLVAILAALAVGALIGAIYAHALHPLRHAELRLDAGRACWRSSGLQLYILGGPARSTCPTARRW